MPPETKWTADTRFRTTIGSIVAVVAVVAGGAGWATAVNFKFGAVDKNIESIAHSVDRIDQRVQQLADFHTRISLLEASVADLKENTP